MKRMRRTISVLLALCLLVTQVQVWASAGLGCRVEAAAAALAAPCTLHRTEAPQPGKVPPGCLLNCQKCALHCAVGLAALPPSVPLLCRLDGFQDPNHSAGRHYYRFSPGCPHRPPIA
jgi:hypothetical protein